MSDELDVDVISQELCRALRGPRSQVQLARRLGYRSNVPASWESGRTAPPASTFFRACERVGLAIRPGLQAFLSADVPLDLSVVEGVAGLIRLMRGSRSTVALAAQAGISRHALGRWQRAEAEPRLPDLLRVARAGTNRLLDFLEVFVDPSRLPSAAEAWDRLRSGRDLLVAHPWVQPVLLCLELQGYQALPEHDEAWIADRLGLPVEQVAHAVERLADTDQIAWTGTHWRLHQVRTIDTRREAAGVPGMRAWFARRALDHLVEDDPDAVFSQNLFTISEEDLQRLRALHVEHFRAVRALINQSEPGERIVLLQRSIVPVDRLKSSVHPATSPG